MTVEEFTIVFDFICSCTCFVVLGFSLFVLVDLCLISYETKVIQKRIKERLDDYDKEKLEILSEELENFRSTKVLNKLKFFQLRSERLEEKHQKENALLETIGVTRDEIYGLIRDITYKYLENHISLIICNCFWYGMVAIIVLGVVFLRIIGMI